MQGKTASEYLKQNLTDLKEETDIATIRIADYSTLIPVIGRGSRKREKKKKSKSRNNLENVTNIITDHDLIDI